MRRRTFLMSSAALLSLGLALPGAHGATSTTVCGFDKRRKQNLCTVRLTKGVQFVAAKKGGSEIENCWIACLQMVFQYYGHVVPAANILRDIYEGRVPKSPWQDLTPLRRPLSDEKNKRVGVITEK